MKKNSKKTAPDQTAAASRIFAALAELASQRRADIAPTPLSPNRRTAKLVKKPASLPRVLN